MRPALNMTDRQIADELADLERRWDDLQGGDPDDYGGGSPGEWMFERMGELEQEQKRRAKGGGR